MVKRTKLSDFKVSRYSKPIKCISLKINDEVVTVSNDMGTDVAISTNNGYLLRYDINEISIIGIKGSGVKAITLKNDYVVSAHIFTVCEYLTVITDKGTGKRIKLTEFERTSRARKGILMVRDVKTNPYSILNTFITYGKENIGLKSKDVIKYIKNTELPIVDRYSTGTIISKTKISAAFLKQDLYEKDKKKEEEIIEKEVSLKQVDEQIMTIDDFLDDFKIE